MNVIIPSKLLHSLTLECKKHAPMEACGLLIGDCKETENASIHAFIPMKNNAVTPTNTFCFHPAEWVEKWYLHRHELVGVYHSHPNTAAIPSRADIDLAQLLPHCVHVIISLQTKATPAICAYDAYFKSIKLHLLK